ncbi:MAG: hypothetical protein M1828_006201 [Chrysothrix sp. TS-e1954]|nr:MAG: hypothetical protein M1828_006201 [Chrysothrix sp. TS-e1954]
MTSQPSHACCNTPAIVANDYKEKGAYTTIDGLKTYSTGPTSAEHGLLFIYDIFGFFPQTLQGADIMSTGDSTRPYQVFMPDFFEGSPADISWFPPDTKEKGEKLGAFFQKPEAGAKTVLRIPKIIQEIQSSHPNIKSWAILGLCWGGKMVNLSSQKGTQFKAAVSAHPAMVDPKDAAATTIPFFMIPSEGEKKEDVEAWEKEIKVKNKVEWYPKQVHGFMGGRADLSDSKVVSAYQGAYKQSLEWFHDNMNESSAKI